MMRACNTHLLCVTLTHATDGDYSSSVPIEPLYARMGAIIRSRRRAKELSQQALAQLIGLSRATLASMERGRQRILVHQLCLFAEALECSASELLPLPEGGQSDHVSLTFSEAVSDKQREQLSRIISTVQVPSRTSSEVSRAPATPRRARQARR